MKRHIIFSMLLTLVISLTSTAQNSINKDKIDTLKNNSATQAQFPGGMAALMNFINKNKHYANYEDRDNGVGIVKVSFVIGIDGAIGDTVKILKPLAEFYDKEAIRIIKVMPKWLPATVNGQSVRTSFSLPIKF